MENSSFATDAASLVHCGAWIRPASCLRGWAGAPEARPEPPQRFLVGCYAGNQVTPREAGADGGSWALRLQGAQQAIRHCHVIAPAQVVLQAGEHSAISSQALPRIEGREELGGIAKLLGGDPRPVAPLRIELWQAAAALQ